MTTQSCGLSVSCQIMKQIMFLIQCHRSQPALLVSLTRQCLCLHKISLAIALPEFTLSVSASWAVSVCQIITVPFQGFSVEGQENIQEILSKRLYLCQFLCALMNLRPGLYHMCKAQYVC